MIINIYNFGSIFHPLFSTPCWLWMCYGLNLPPLSWEHPTRLSSSPLLKNTPSYMCCCTSSSSFHFATFFVPFCYFAIILSWGRAVPLNYNAKIKALVEEGNSCTFYKVRKGKSHHSCFCVWGLHVDHHRLWGGASFCIVLCGNHCLDHAGCQGCCYDTNDIWDTSVPVRYFESLGH